MSRESAPDPSASHPLARGIWAAVGLLCVGLGTLGAFLPGLPTTVFFIGAAACFARSSPRLERWVLGLPTIGPLVQDYRDGLGMPRRAKRLAIAAIVVAVSLSAWALPSWGARAAVVALGLVGIAYITTRVPTRERVLVERASSGLSGDDPSDDDDGPAEDDLAEARRSSDRQLVHEPRA